MQPNTVEQDITTYLIRNKHSKYLVAVYDILETPSTTLCSLSQDISVVVEEITYRLSDLGSLTLEEGLYVMTCILRACEVLQKNEINFYMLDENNICFNGKG